MLITIERGIDDVSRLKIFVEVDEVLAQWMRKHWPRKVGTLTTRRRDGSDWRGLQTELFKRRVRGTFGVGCHRGQVPATVGRTGQVQ